MKSILITGCSTGFGLETSIYLAERGFQVYATMRDLSRRTDLDEAAERRNVQLRVLPLDVTKPEMIQSAIETIVAETGHIYGVINNAGLLIRGYLEDLAEDEVRDVFEANLFGTMAVTRAALPHMRAAGEGRIVIVTSVAGRIGSPSGGAYSASRFAQEGFGEALYQEVAPLGICVTLIEPGITKTQRWTLDRGAAVKSQNPESPYYKWFCQAEALFNQAMESSPIKSIDVSEKIYEALTDTRPRLRYLIGRRANLILTLRYYLPDYLFEKYYFGEVIRRVTGQH